jgi:hypothetical protein
MGTHRRLCLSWRTYKDQEGDLRPSEGLLERLFLSFLCAGRTVWCSEVIDVKGERRSPSDHAKAVIPVVEAKFYTSSYKKTLGSEISLAYTKLPRGLSLKIM